MEWNHFEPRGQEQGRPYAKNEELVQKKIMARAASEQINNIIAKQK